MIAPHTLSLHGNLAGAWGNWLPIGLGLTAGVFLLNLMARRQLSGTADPLTAETALYRDVSGTSAALAVPLAGRLLTALAGATGLLVTAGFAFNETFVYWFPNFAFAFMLLGVVVAIHLGGPRFVQRSQQVFISLVLGALLLLVIIALPKLGASTLPQTHTSIALGVEAWPALLLLFVGLDLVFLHDRGETSRRSDLRRAILYTLAGATTLYIVWGWLAVHFVSLERLTDTTIAPVIIARSIWGQAGRYTMGVVTIAGTLAAVNALYSIMAATLSQVRHPAAPDLDEKPSGASSKATVVVLGAITALLMGTGMAGTDEIDVVLRAGLVLWLLHYGLLPLLAFFKASKADTKRRLILLFGGLPLLLGVAAISFSDAERALLLGFMGGGLLAAVLLIAALMWLPRYRRTPTQQRSV